MTQVASSSTYNANGTFTLNLTGTDAGGSGLAYFEVFVAIDAQGAVLVGPAVPAGVASSNGTYQRHDRSTRVSPTASAIRYRFYSVGIDAAGLVQPTPSLPNVTDANVVIQPPSQLAVTGLTVENGAAERSYIRYLDVNFNESDAQSGGAPRRSPDSVETPTPSDHALQVRPRRRSRRARRPSRSQGLRVGHRPRDRDRLRHRRDRRESRTRRPPTAITSWRSPAERPGTATHHFYRLLGDVNGDGTVDQNDLNEIAAARGQSLTQIATAINQPASGLTALSMDVNGDGSVNTTDLALATKSKGNKLGTGLPLG